MFFSAQLGNVAELRFSLLAQKLENHFCVIIKKEIISLWSTVQSRDRVKLAIACVNIAKLGTAKQNCNVKRNLQNKVGF